MVRYSVNVSIIVSLRPSNRVKVRGTVHVRPRPWARVRVKVKFR
jgi:hypothetical protein